MGDGDEGYMATYFEDGFDDSLLAAATTAAAVSPPSEIQPCSLPLPYAEPELPGDDQTESGSLEVLADGQEEERWGISSAAQLDDMSGNHQERREIPLVRGQVSVAEGKAVPKHDSLALESTLPGTGLEGPGQLHLEMQQTAVDGFSLATDTSNKEPGELYLFKQIPGTTPR